MSALSDLEEAMRRAGAALDGNSNDAEHDALVDLLGCAHHVARTLRTPVKDILEVVQGRMWSPPVALYDQEQHAPLDGRTHSQIVAARDQDDDIREIPGATLRFDDDGKPIVEIAECGHCGARWNNAAISDLTPTPSARCPFEYEHEYPTTNDSQE